VFFDDPEAGGTVISGEVFLTAPMLRRVHLTSVPTLIHLGTAALRSVSAALRRGALQQLNRLKLNGANLGEANFKDFLNALEYSVCIGRLQWLAFHNCGMDREYAFAGRSSFARRVSSTEAVGF